MKITGTLRKILFLGTAAWLSLVLSNYLWKRFDHSGQDLQATAVGLRGTSRVSKDLSTLQAQKLQEHFLETPAVVHVSQGLSDVQNEVNAINKFNQRQRR